MMAAINKSGNRKLIIILIGLHTTVKACRRPPNQMTPPAEPHNKYILFNGEANTMQACGKPHVSSRFISS